METATKSLSRDAILAVPDLKTEEVQVPEWDGAVIVRGLTGTERDAFEDSCVQIRGKERTDNYKNVRARLAVLAVVDEQGHRIFTDEDAEALGKKSASALDRIFSVAQRLSGLSRKDLEDLERNLGLGPNGGSASASLSSSG